MVNKLKPCPFCGKEPMMYVTPPDKRIPKKERAASRWFYVVCMGQDCNMSVGTPLFDNPKEAIETWNRRAEAEE